MLKKMLGIGRSRLQQFQMAKLGRVKRKNRFKADKDLDDELTQQSQSNNLITNSTQNSVGHEPEVSKSVDIYEEAKQNLRLVAQYKIKISAQCKSRITAFKESEAKKYDENICNLSRKAIEHLLMAEKTLSAIRRLKGTNDAEQKYYRNMERSLAQQLRQSSKQLRAQQKEHFDRLKSYEKGTTNAAIELSETQKEKMKGEYGFEEETSVAMIEELQQHARDSQINELVKSINKLSTIYKELNELVIEQGSLIDRIDVNIEETLTHVEKGNEHLRGAEDNASSPCAQKCMLVLISFIVVLAIILGFKYSR